MSSGALNVLGVAAVYDSFHDSLIVAQGCSDSNIYTFPGYDSSTAEWSYNPCNDNSIFESGHARNFYIKPMVWGDSHTALNGFTVVATLALYWNFLLILFRCVVNTWVTNALMYMYPLYIINSASGYSLTKLPNIDSDECIVEPCYLCNQPSCQDTKVFDDSLIILAAACDDYIYRFVGTPSDSSISWESPSRIESASTMNIAYAIAVYGATLIPNFFTASR